MEHFYQNIGPENWFDYEDLYRAVVNGFANNSTFIEVGSWKGRSSAFMAVEIINSGKNIKFHCVDTWEGSEEHANEEVIKNNTLFNVFCNNIDPVKNAIHPVKMSSTEAAKLYENNSIDFIFIDACHTYDCVKEDIINWFPKVKPNGILAGHDYSWETVKKAVHELLPNAQHCSQNCWFIKKT